MPLSESDRPPNGTRVRIILPGSLFCVGSEGIISDQDGSSAPRVWVNGHGEHFVSNQMMELVVATVATPPASSPVNLAAMLHVLTVRDAAKIVTALESRGITAAEGTLIDALLLAADDLAKVPAPAIPATPLGFAPPATSDFFGISRLLNSAMPSFTRTGV